MIHVVFHLRPLIGKDGIRLRKSSPESGNFVRLNTIGYRLRYVRNRRGWTIYDVESFTGVPAATLAEYERNNMPVPSDRLPVLARLLSVSIEWLVTGKDTAENLRRKWPEGFATWSRLMRTLDDNEKDNLLALADAFLKHKEQLSEIVDWNALAKLRDTEGTGDPLVSPPADDNEAPSSQ